MLVSSHLFLPTIAISFPVQVLQLHTSGVVSKVESTYTSVLSPLLPPVTVFLSSFIWQDFWVVRWFRDSILNVCRTSISQGFFFKTQMQNEVPWKPRGHQSRQSWELYACGTNGRQSHIFISNCQQLLLELACKSSCGLIITISGI